jgi:hypothetical protein
MNSGAIKKLVKKKQIKFLMHFTRVENLSSILKHGLLSRYEVESNHMGSLVTDSSRLDGYTSAVNLSISFPNYSMFYSKRQNMGGDWVVLFINPEVLYKKPCYFYSKNAACFAYDGLDDRSSGTHFQDMFSDLAINNLGNIVSRDDLSLPCSYPTNPQSEVLVFSKLIPAMIMGVVFLSTTTRSNYFMCNSDNSNVQPYISKSRANQFFFSSRQDWRYWSCKG